MTGIYFSEPAEINFGKKVNVLEDIPIRPATMITSQIGMSFEERVLKELSDLKKTQQSFEARIEKRIETFVNDHSRMQDNSRRVFKVCKVTFLIVGRACVGTTSQGCNIKVVIMVEFEMRYRFDIGSRFPQNGT